MNRIILLAVAAMLGSLSAARADFGGPVLPPFPMGPDAAAPTGDRYGTAPFLRKLLWWRGGAAGGCSGCGASHGAGVPGFPPGAANPAFGAAMPGIGYPGTPGYAMPGTLVFPHHPFMRSPRDFFMYEPNR